ncbi:MAG: hypothetical protein R2748_25010 [Bryobacterales bacterium]
MSTQASQWRKYLSSPDTGLSSLRWQEYRIQNPSGEKVVRSMLAPPELTLLYYLARDHYSGRGEIVDLGPLLGVGTNMLARGLQANERSIPKSKRIYSYDLFLTDGMGHYVDDCGPATGSVFEAFQDLNRDYRESIFVSPGDLLALRWTGEPIEICFVDVAKSLPLNFHVIEQFFGSLVEGAALVQQDYVYFDQYWISYTMEYFAEYFSPPEFVFGATACFYLKRPIDKGRFQDFRALSFDDRLSLKDRAIAKAPASVAPVLLCGKAKMLFDEGRVEEARQALAKVEPVGHRDPVVDFSAIAQSNREMVARIIGSTA